MLKDKIQQDQIMALKSANTETLSLLRFLLSEIKNWEISTQRESTDEEIVTIIRKQVKKLEEAAVMFDRGGRKDMALDNRKQVKILSDYLPSEIADEELIRKIKQIIVENAELYKKNPKAIIGIVVGRLKSEASPSRIMTILNSL